MPYERIIIWISPDFLNSQLGKTFDLSTCFQLTSQKGFRLIRPEKNFQTQVKTLLVDLESSLSSTAFGNELMSDAIFLQLLIYINRIILENKLTFSPSSFHYDEKIQELIHYINSHLEDDLIKRGTPVTEACLKCGFRDYSTFLRGFKKLFYKNPSEY